MFGVLHFKYAESIAGVDLWPHLVVSTYTARILRATFLASDVMRQDGRGEVTGALILFVPCRGKVTFHGSAHDNVCDVARKWSSSNDRFRELRRGSVSRVIFFAIPVISAAGRAGVRGNLALTEWRVVFHRETNSK